MTRATLTVFCGLPGVGKSAASSYAADNAPATRYRSDEVRKQLFPDPEYTDAETDATYEELLERAREDLEAGDDVVLDATFRRKRFRDRAAAVADDAGADLVFVRVTCDVDAVEERLAERTDDVSDAAFEQHLRLREEFEPIERDRVAIDNSGSLEETHRQLDEALL